MRMNMTPATAVSVSRSFLSRSPFPLALPFSLVFFEPGVEPVGEGDDDERVGRGSEDRADSESEEDVGEFSIHRVSLPPRSTPVEAL